MLVQSIGHHRLALDDGKEGYRSAKRICSYWPSQMLVIYRSIALASTSKYICGSFCSNAVACLVGVSEPCSATGPGYAYGKGNSSALTIHTENGQNWDALRCISNAVRYQFRAPYLFFFSLRQRSTIEISNLVLQWLEGLRT
jgi:hypothetical protein